MRKEQWILCTFWWQYNYSETRSSAAGDRWQHLCRATYGTCPLSDVVHVPGSLRCFLHDMWTLSSDVDAVSKARGDDSRLYHPSFAHIHYQLICHSWTMKHLVTVDLSVFIKEHRKESGNFQSKIHVQLPFSFFLLKTHKRGGLIGQANTNLRLPYTKGSHRRLLRVVQSLYY